MNTKKFLQLFVLMAMLLTSLAFTSPAFAWSACGTSVIVANGDTLRLIAGRCGTTVSALRLANPEVGNGNLIFPGQSLLLPGAILSGNNGYDTYLVARGDTLKSLAIRFGTSVGTLLSLNGNIANANVIFEGQRLTVPSGRAVPGNPPPSSGQVYYAQRGDTLRIIAAKFGTTVDVLIRLNPQIMNPNIIYVGQAISVPGGGSSYIVQRGDTLKIIAAKFGTTVDALLALNPKIYNPNVIYVGQVVIVR